MNKIIEQDIKNLDEYQLPEGLHGQIMRQLLFYRAFRPLVATLVIILVNTLLLGWSIYTKTEELQTVSIITAMSESFNLTYNFFVDFLTGALDALPVISIITLACNLIVGFYVTRILLILSRFKLETSINQKTK
ncbi:MAG: hypothetical protein WCO03_03025 [bacterium]